MSESTAAREESLTVLWGDVLAWISDADAWDDAEVFLSAGGRDSNNDDEIAIVVGAGEIRIFDGTNQLQFLPSQVPLLVQAIDAHKRLAGARVTK